MKNLKRFCDFSLNQEISSSLGLIFVLVLSTAVAMGTVVGGLRLADRAQEAAELENAKRLDMIAQHLDIQKEKRAQTKNAFPKSQ